MICLSSLSNLNSRGIISPTSLLLTMTFGNPAGLICSSKLTFLSHHCCMAGTWVLPVLLQYLKQYLVGFWRVWWNLKVIVDMSPHTMHLLPPETTCYANSGKLKKVQETISCVHCRSKQCCLTSKKNIIATKQVDLLSPFIRNATDPGLHLRILARWGIL